MEPFSAFSKALPPSTRVFAFRGTEALSTLYRFELYLFIEEPAFDMGAAIGADATFSLNRVDGRPPILLHGILESVETIGDLLHGALYRAVLVPRLQKLVLTHHSLVFVKRTMPQILEAVLQDNDLEKEKDFVFRLSARYQPYEHVCQYRESSFDFLSRRMEREGVYYFFEQGEERERLVITDDLHFHAPLSPEAVRWVRVAGTGAKGGSGLRLFTCKHKSIPGRVHVKDYDYLKPALDVSGHAPASGWRQEIILHAENAVTPEDSRRLAKLRAEELLARQVLFRGTGRGAVYLRPGYTFTVEDHPRFDGQYLTIELDHRGKQGGLPEGAEELIGGDADLQSHGDEDSVYRFDVVAIPAKVQFRPERRTPVPRIYGLEKAVVDGEADHHYAQLDEHGRYLVKIMFDESALRNGKASTRIRMMQPHAGNPESFHFPLRKGTEVLLAFDGGDPDRPVIAGVVPNLHKPTLVTSANNTMNLWETGGRNRIQIDDREGFQHFRISSPTLDSFIHLGAPNDSHNKITYSLGNSLSATGQDSETDVGLTRLTVIGGFFYKTIPFKDPDGVAIVGNDSDRFLVDGNGIPILDANNQPTKIPDPKPKKAAQEADTKLQVAEHDVDNTGGDPIIEEARGVSAASISDVFGSTQKNSSSQPTETKPDLILTPLTMFRDPDGRPSYRVGSDLKYVRGDNVTKVGGDDLKAVLGDEKKHVHGSNTTNIDRGQVSTVVPTHTTIDILKTALYVSQFSFGVTNVSVTVLSTSQSLVTIKNYGTELTKVIMKIIS